jgi:hypothetical protein
MRGWGLTEPEPATEVPIRYELAYGGAYALPAQTGDSDGPRWCIEESNPCGSGFFDARSLDKGRFYPGPQWEHPLHPVTAINHPVPLSGFGPTARSWSSRLQYAGTYDAAWEERAHSDMRQGLPADYPADFDLRFFNGAHPELISRTHLRGDEQIGLAGLTGSAAPFIFSLPGVSLRAELLDVSGRWREEQILLDTVHIDLDTASVHLCWRLTLDEQRDVRSAVIAEGTR